MRGTPLHDYTFALRSCPAVSLLPLGMAGLLNHAASAPNAAMELAPAAGDGGAGRDGANGGGSGSGSLGRWRLVLRALSEIRPGDEVLISYGADYWAERGLEPVA